MKYIIIRCMNTKQLILEKTLKLMIEKQNSIVSIREISEVSGIAIGGIYHYFSNKEEIYDEITERYFLNYIKLDIDKLRQINGTAKEKIHNVMVEIFNQRQAGIEIETIGEIDYRIILAVLTANGFAYENSMEMYRGFIIKLKEFLSQIIAGGQKNREIRQDLPAEDIADSLFIMCMGIQYKWEIFLIDDMVSAFENNYDLEWEKIRFKG